jgi:hypothetical protein
MVVVVAVLVTFTKPEKITKKSSFGHLGIGNCSLSMFMVMLWRRI